MKSCHAFLLQESSVSVTGHGFPSHQDILRHERWLTTLVAGLVSPADVDDVLQGTWLAALERPPRHRRASRAWLGKVARNLAFDSWKARRRRSEASASRPPSVPSTEETVDRLETFELLLGVVRGLAEPYRTAVLLRHYHGLSVREVAQRLGLTEAAARQRVKRGLDEVRRKLTERVGPRWRERLGAVLTLVPRGALLPMAPAMAFGILLMKTKYLVFCGAAAVLAAGVSLVASLQPSALPEQVEEGSEMAAAITAPAVERIPAPPRVAVEGPAGENTPLWAGRVLDLHGLPVAGARLLDASGELVAETDAAGRFGCPRRGDIPRLEPRFHALRKVRDPDPEEPVELLFVVAPSARVAGAVSTASGVPLEDVRIAVETRALVDFPTSLERTWPVAMPEGRTDTDGTFAFDSVPGGISRLRFEKPGYRIALRDVAEQSDLALQIVLEEAEGGIWLLSGQVLDTAGWAIPDAVVGLGEEQVRTDAFGRYELVTTREDLEDTEDAFYAARRGYRTLVLEAPRPEEFGEDRGLERDLVLPGPALSIHGRVLDPDGAPAAGAMVALWRVEHMAGAGFAEELATEPGAEPPPFGVQPRHPYSVSDEDGAFSLGGLLDREYELRVLHPELLAMTSPPIRAGAAGVELRYPADNLRTLRCRVVNTEGRPMPGLRIDTSMQASQTSGSSTWDIVDDLHTGEDGEVILPRILRREAMSVRVRGDEIITAIEEITPGSPEPFVVRVERRCFFRIETADPRWAVSLFELETATGETAWISETRGTYNAQYRLVEGRTPVLTTSELAATLVVGGSHRVPLALVPGGVVVVQF